MSGFSDELDEMDELFARTLAGMAARLDAETDFDAMLDDIYTRAAGIETMPPPTASAEQESARARKENEQDSAEKAVSDRIAMLIAVLDSPAARHIGSPTIVATVYLPAARRALRRLHGGLVARELSRTDALRLVGNLQHNLREADTLLHEEQGNSLTDALRDRVAGLRELGGDISAHVDAIRAQIVRLFDDADASVEVAPVSSS